MPLATCFTKWTILNNFSVIHICFSISTWIFFCKNRFLSRKSLRTLLNIIFLESSRSFFSIFHVCFDFDSLLFVISVYDSKYQSICKQIIWLEVNQGNLVQKKSESHLRLKSICMFSFTQKTTSWNKKKLMTILTVIQIKRKIPINRIPIFRFSCILFKLVFQLKFLIFLL